MENADGSLVCFVRDDLDNGPINVVCSNWPDELGDCVRIGTRFISAGIQRFRSETMTFDVSSSKTYFPAEPPIFDPQRARQGLEKALGVLAEMVCPDSLAMLLIKQPGFFGEKESPQQIFFVRAAEHLDAIRAWLGSRSANLRNPIGEIIGLGPGLTPSGDDVVVGILVALHAIGNKKMAHIVASCLSHHARKRTNRISQAHLLSAAGGFAVEPLHDCLNDVLAGGEHLPELLPSLRRIGHTSGWDAFAGIFLAIGSACGFSSSLSPLFYERAV